MTPVPDDQSFPAIHPYGQRAMRYLREHCPTRYAAITDPEEYFQGLGEELRREVETFQRAWRPAPGQDPAETAGQANMTLLMAEEAIFAELYQAMPPEESDDDLPGWEPLLPDMSDLDQADAENSVTDRD